MKKYDKIFVPVENMEEDCLFQYMDSYNEPFKEQQNVIVLTDNELKELLDDSYNKGRTFYEQMISILFK